MRSRLNHLCFIEIFNFKTDMKTIQNILMPKVILFRTVLVAAIAIGSISCDSNNNNTNGNGNGTTADNQKQEDTKEVAKEANDEKLDNDKEKDADFLVKAAEINLEEIQLGQLAQSKATITDVKELGKMMEKAHKKAQDDLVALAGKKSITVPTSTTDKGKDAYEKLSDNKGNKFDKDYCDKMVDGHKDAIDLFEKASRNANDPEIRQWAANSLPELNMHLEHSLKCQKLTEKM